MNPTLILLFLLSIVKKASIKKQMQRELQFMVCMPHFGMLAFIDKLLAHTEHFF